MTSPGELTPPLTWRLERGLSPAPLHPQKVPSLAPIDTAIYVVKVSVSTISTNLLPVFKISDFERTEYRADVLNADHPAQAVRLTDLDRVEKLRNMFRESSRVSDFGSFSMAKKNALSDRLSVPRLAVYGKLAVPLFFVNGFHRRAMSTIVNDVGTDWASFGK